MAEPTWRNRYFVGQIDDTLAFLDTATTFFMEGVHQEAKTRGLSHMIPKNNLQEKYFSCVISDDSVDEIVEHTCKLRRSAEQDITVYPVMTTPIFTKGLYESPHPDMRKLLLTFHKRTRRVTDSMHDIVS